MDAPTANQTAAMRVARAAKRPAMSASNSAVAMMSDRVATSRGPISQPSAGASTL